MSAANETSLANQQRIEGDALRCLRHHTDLNLIDVKGIDILACMRVEEGRPLKPEDTQTYAKLLGCKNPEEAVIKALNLLQTYQVTCPIGLGTKNLPPLRNAQGEPPYLLTLPSTYDIAIMLAERKFKHPSSGRPNHTLIAEKLGISRISVYKKRNGGLTENFTNEHYKNLGLALGMPPECQNPHYYLIQQYINSGLATTASHDLARTA